MKKFLIYLALTILISFTAYSQNSWTKLSPFPDVQNLYDAYFIDEQKGWVVGSGGLINFTNDGGITWETQHINDLNDEYFNSVVFSGENEGWVVGWGKIYHTIDAGENWELQTRPPVIGDLQDVYFIDQDTGWIVGYYKIILKTTDGGENWIKISNSVASERNFFGVYFTDALHGCAVGGVDMSYDKCFIMVTEDGGDSWIDTSPEGIAQLNDVYFISKDTGFACGFDGQIIRTTDGGYTWGLKYEHYGFSPNDIFFFNALNGIATDRSEYSITEDGGETWTLSYMDDDMLINGFNGVNDTVGFGVGPDGLVVKTTNKGYNWEPISNAIPLPYLNNIGFFDEFNGIKTTYNTLMMTDDGGYSWSVKEVGIDVKYKDLSVPSSTVGYILSNNNNKLVKTMNGGQDWSIYDLPVLPENVDYTRIQFVTELVGYLCGENGYVYRTEDGGQTWQDKSIMNESDLTAIYFVNENLGWLTNEDGQVMRTVSGGNSYSYYQLEVNNTVYKPLDVFFVNEQIGYIATTQGALFKTGNGGITWDIISNISSGAFLTKIYFSDEITGWYKATDKILYTENGGVSWELQQNYNDTWLTDMFFLNENYGWLCGENNFIAKYDFPVNVGGVKKQNSIMSIYPNPSNDMLSVSTNTDNDLITHYSISDLNGRLLIASNGIQNQKTIRIDISKLNVGMYLLKIKLNNQYNISKFIKN